MRNAHYDDDPAGYSARRNAWVHVRRRRAVSEFLTGAAAGDIVVEVGSGTGDLIVALAQERPDLKFIGVDPLAKYVEFAADRAREAGVSNVEFRVGEAEHLEECITEQPRWVFTSDVLHHVDDLDAAVSSIAAAVPAGSRWLAIEPNIWNPWMLAFCTFAEGERNFRSRPFLRAAGGAGWAVASKDRLFLIPGVIKDPPPWMKALEGRFERNMVLAGGLALQLRLIAPRYQESHPEAAQAPAR